MLTKLKIILCTIITMTTMNSECVYSGCEAQIDNNMIENNVIETKEEVMNLKEIAEFSLEPIDINENMTENNEVEDVVIETKIGIDNEADTVKVIEPISLGFFKLTAYCSCEKCCEIWSKNRPVDEYGNEIVYGAIGEVLKAGYSIATDPNVIPYNSKVMINGQIYEVQDCGGAIKQNRIDVYCSSHQDAVNFGVQYAEAFLMPE